ncbi:MAG TPA: DNA-3-methyladenine glycosylase 2 family protein [Caulobacteraceae bacterium]
MTPGPSPEQLAHARRALAATDPAMARVDAVVPPFAFRIRKGGFHGLFKMIVEQQVSVASAAAIWGRVETALGDVTPARVLQHEQEQLRAMGLSLQKARYAHEIANATHVDLDALQALPDEEAIAALTAIKGVGRWTAETYLMFCEGRLDIFPAGDIALIEALRWADGLDERPSIKATYARSLDWAPHRSTAAHLLWAWYGHVKRRELPHPEREAAA